MSRDPEIDPESDLGREIQREIDRRSKKQLKDLAKLHVDAMEPVKETAEEIGNRKVVKGAKKIGKMFTSMVKASIQAQVIEKLFMVLQPVLNLLNLFNPIFAMLASIVQEALLPVIKLLVPYIRDATMWLHQNRKEIVLLITVLSPLLLLIKYWVEIAQALTIATNAVIGAINILIGTYNIINDYIRNTLNPAWDILITTLTNVYNYVDDIIISVFNDLITTLTNVYNYIEDTIISVFNDLKDKLKSVKNKVDELIEYFDDLKDAVNNIISLGTGGGIGGGIGGGGGGDGGNDDPVWYDPRTWFADGGYANTPTNAVVGEAGPEFIFTQEQTQALAGMGLESGMAEYYLATLVNLAKQTLETKETTYVRRKYG
jgi:hypothetical protein